MIKNYIEKANFEDTGFSYTLSLISGKHKMVILYCLTEFEVVRFNEMKLPAASCGVSARDSLRSSLVCCAASCGELNPLWD